MRRELVLMAVLVPSSAGAGAPLEKFGWFADLVGSCWQGTFPDGKTQHTHCYTPQFDQFIRGSATLAGDHNGIMQDKFFGDSVFAWDEKNRRMTYYIWGSDGSHGRHEALYEGEDLSFPVHARDDSSRLVSRSLWHRLDATSFEVRRQVPVADGWKTELTVVYRKAASR